MTTESELSQKEERRINLKVGETYRLELRGLSSAGYTWEYTIDGLKEIVNISTEMIGDIPKPSQSFDRHKVFNITAMHHGTTHVRIFLRRSWENKPPLKELSLIISVP